MSTGTTKVWKRAGSLNVKHNVWVLLHKTTLTSNFGGNSLVARFNWIVGCQGNVGWQWHPTISD